jgi:DNA mismatch repair protein MutS2
VIVTGPNSGGKTRLLQAIALTQMLAQAGLFVPAASATLPWSSGLFVSLLEHARADQSEGKLGTELLRIRRLFENLSAGSVVILDELCAGTNPDEGEEIFRLVVKLLAELGPTAFITTHFLRFAARLEAEKHPGLVFLKVELDANEDPTFQFVPGVASTSLAHRTALRLGVTEEALRAAMKRSR